MKFTIIPLTVLFLANQSNAFVARTSAALSRPSFLKAAVELMPEPEGGDELEAVTTMPNSRIKKMKEESEVTSDLGTVYSFWLKAEALAPLIKEVHTQVLRDASKKANFPGFRKGQVPPYAMPQIKGFAVQEGIVKTIQAAVEAYGLKPLPGSAGEAKVLEDIPEVARAFKLGESVEFTATFNAVVDNERVTLEDEKKVTAPTDVVDAEVETTSD